MLILDKERDLFLKAVYRWTFYILGMLVLALGLLAPRGIWQEAFS